MKKTNQLKTVLLVGAIIGFVCVVFLMYDRGEVEVLIDESSEITKNVTMSFSADRFRKKHPAPGTIKLRAGTHIIAVGAPDSDLVEQRITIKRGETLRLNFYIKKDPAHSLDPEIYSNSLINSIPHLSLFPHITNDFRLDAVLNENLDTIYKIELTVNYRFSEEFEDEMRQNAIADTNTWLSKNGIINLYDVVVVN